MRVFAGQHGTRIVGALRDFENTRWERFLKIAQRTNDTRPVLTSEYAHAMGNAIGNLQEYWDEIYSNPRMLGGFIWEWCDQGLRRTLPDGQRVIAYGGDFDDHPNLGAFCIKGIVTSDRKIYPKYWEVKKVYQPVAIEPMNLKPGRAKVKITNRNSFLNLDQYEAGWSVTDDGGETIQSGVLGPIHCAPGKEVEVRIPVAKIHRPKAGAEFWLRLGFRTRTECLWAPAGYEIASQQIRLPSGNAPSPRPSPIRRERLNAAPQLALTDEGNGHVTIQGTNFSVAFSRSAGTLISLKFDGREMLPESTNEIAGPVLQLYRAPTDNDKGFGHWLARDWHEAELDRLARRVDSFKVSRPRPDLVQVRTSATSSAAHGGYTDETTWTIHGDGLVEMENHFSPFGELPATLPRIGVMMRLGGAFENFRWFGCGPWENYPDRKESADMGVWFEHCDRSICSLYPPAGEWQQGRRALDRTDGRERLWLAR